VLILLLFQILIGATIYEQVPVAKLKPGMILSAMSSLLMQTSITRGLPAISTEDLKSRLTNEEIESVKIWAKATHVETLTVVKKIPFAIFISIGLLIYVAVWGGLLWD
jgi:preflagellin peptidase FlaK